MGHGTGLVFTKGPKQMGDTRDCIMHPKVADYPRTDVQRVVYGFRGIFDEARIYGGRGIARSPPCVSSLTKGNE